MGLVTIWSCLVGLAIIFYVVLDGFSLGVALLFPTARDEGERDLLMDSIAPVWDANQTWIVFGGGALFVAFPMVYGVLFSALYIPLLTFIFGLIFRGVAFEFRANATRKRALEQGVFLRKSGGGDGSGIDTWGIISGIKVYGGQFTGGPFDWLNPFSVTIGIALISGYALLGSTYLIIKTTGPVQDRAYRQAFWSSLCGPGVPDPGHLLDASPLPLGPDLLV